MKRHILSILLSLLCIGVVCGQVWDIARLKTIPACRILKQDSVVSLVYEGLPYRGTPKEVFAYYCTPGILSGDIAKDKDLPAIVLVHGGGGTAFREWVALWARKGYAAIAMDLRGFGEGRKPLEHGFREPLAGTPYFAAGDTLEEHWLYQAVGDVMLAHSLVRNFPETDSSRTAITGINWGGVITCMIAGLDARFKAFAPVYGCGFLYEHSAMAAPIHALPPNQYEKWVHWYDPSNYVGQARCPGLFVNGTNDSHFYLDVYKKTYSLVKNRTLCIKPRMKHGHPAGWASSEIYVFINSILNKTTPLPVLDGLKRSGRTITARVRSRESIVSADLHYTVDTCELKSRQWLSMSADLKRGKIIVRELPAATTVWFVSVTDKRGCYVSGDIVFEEPYLQ